VIKIDGYISIVKYNKYKGYCTISFKNTLLERDLPIAYFIKKKVIEIM
jgi:hypothetical protein